MRLFIAACLGIALSTTAFATTFLPLSFEQLVDASAIVVYGRVADVRAQWSDDHRFIESVVSLDVFKGIKGAARETISFSVPGGQVGRYINVMPGAPVFTTGDLAVVFLTSRGARLPVTTGLMQGVYRVQRDDVGELLVVPPALEASGRIVRGDVRRKPVRLSTFESTVRTVAAR